MSFINIYASWTEVDDHTSYVGTLHEINPEASTIALENVVSHGTEGRRGEGSEEIAPSAAIYEYIVFRGSDVKDISVAEEQKENKQPEPPQVPDDPAILGVSADSALRITLDTPTLLCTLPYHMMKYSGCYSQTCSESAKRCGYFPLPSF